MAPHSAVVTGQAVDCLEIQLSPLLVRALLDVEPAALDSALVALDDI